jgi:hypothetical protein
MANSSPTYHKITCPICGYTHEEFILTTKHSLKMEKIFRCQNSSCKRWWIVGFQINDKGEHYATSQEISNDKYQELRPKFA